MYFIQKEHPELAKSFFEMANTLYPYGLLSLEKVEKISSNEAEKIFFKNITNLSKIYIEEMNIKNSFNMGIPTYLVVCRYWISLVLSK